MNLESFRARFQALTGKPPFPWQKELFVLFADGRIPACCDLPTGLGKTSVIAIWLIALAESEKPVPRRLVYVVNRRTVVDQTTEEVKRIHKNLPKLKRIGFDTLAISTLRGQFADNREWSADPSQPAVIVGTVDMIGSRLLFSGYGIGFKAKPLHAGFLGQDALLIHDEAHLEPAFQKLLTDIEEEQKLERGRSGELFWPKLKVMQMTATARSGTNGRGDPKSKKELPFQLTKEEKNPPELIPGPRDDEPAIYTVWRRLKAEKRLTFTAVEDEKAVPAKIAKIAETYKDQQCAVLVFARTLDAIATIQKELEKTERTVALLTGTIRGKERDDFVERPEFKRFLKTSSAGETVYLICTSAGEVGIDISGDHMVGDLSTFESMAQRFGRVNRYGVDRNGKPQSSHINVVHPASFGKADKKTGELKADELDKRREKTLSLLRLLPEAGKSDNGDPIYDASPKAFGDLRKHAHLPCKIEDAFAPEPTIPPVTDILFDAWALTSITERMPGRPEVAPYLHGIADDLPQTTIAWRVELDLLKDDPNPKAALKAVFTKHRIRPHESMTVGMTYSRGKWKFRAVEFLEEMVATFPDLLATRVALLFSRGIRLITVAELLVDPRSLSADPTLVLPASFGGLDDKGMLSAPKRDNKKPAPSEASNGDMPADQDASEGRPAASLDIADIAGYERNPDAKARRRLLIDRTESGWTARAIPGAEPLPDGWNLPDPPDKSTPLVRHIRAQSSLKVRLVQPLRWDEEGDLCSLVCLAPPPKQQQPKQETLEDHVGAVEKQADRLASVLLKNDNVAAAALRFAAKWHDEGKKADRWQHYIGRSEGDPLLGKSAEWRDPKLLAGFRHEFGSMLCIVLRVPQQEVLGYFANPVLNLTIEQRQDARELALHVIASHHGYARPHFTHPLDEDFTTPQCEQLHIEVVQRYARLQRKYGRWGLAYLESLLRAADWAASADAGIDPEVDDDDVADLEGGET